MTNRLGEFGYPILSDASSRVIRQFGIFNNNVPEEHPWYGICFPGTFIVDQHGIVQEKYFERLHRQRFTADTILVKRFGEDGIGRLEVKNEHLTVSASASQDSVRPGNRITLKIVIDIEPKVHLYGPQVKNYTPLSVSVRSTPELLAHDVKFPQPQQLTLDAIGETLPVYMNRLVLFQDVTISPRVRKKKVDISAVLSYQACDDKICYAPAKIPFEFEITIEPHDGQRVPKHLRRSGG